MDHDKMLDAATVAEAEESANEMRAITIEKARALILEKHNLALDPADPSLAAVTLHQAFLNDFKQMIEQQRQEYLVANMKQLDAARQVARELLREFADELKRSGNNAGAPAPTIIEQKQEPALAYTLAGVIVLLGLVLVLKTLNAF
jgi:hypothetical protein